MSAPCLQVLAVVGSLNKASVTRVVVNHVAEALRKTGCSVDVLDFYLEPLALFNPAVVLAPVPELGEPDQERITRLKDRMGTDPQALSPFHHVRKGAPPTIIFHGKADTTVPYKTVEIFAKAMTDAGNSCTLVGYEGQAHGFFNHGRGGNEFYQKTVQALDEFLNKLGYTR